MPTSRTIFGSTTVLPGMTMGRQDPGGLNAATSTGMVAHGAQHLQPELLRCHRRHAAELRLDVLHGLRVGRRRSRSTPRRWAPKSAAAAARTSTSSRRAAATAQGQRELQHHRQGLLGSASPATTSPTNCARKASPTRRCASCSDFNADARRAVHRRIACGGSDRSGTTRRSRRRRATPSVNSDGSLTNPFDSNLRNYTTQRQVSGEQEQPVVGVLDLQPEVPAAPRRGRHAAAADRHAAPGSRRRT